MNLIADGVCSWWAIAIQKPMVYEDEDEDGDGDRLISVSFRG